MAVGDAHVFPGFLTPVLKLLSFQSHRLLFSHALAEVTGENTPERKFASNGYGTHNYQVVSPTRSPLATRARLGLLLRKNARNHLCHMIQFKIQNYFSAFFFFNFNLNKPWFLRVCSTGILKTLWGKREIARYEQFLLFPQRFLPFSRIFCHFCYV